MLTSDLLLTRSRGPYIEPRYVDVEDPALIDLAQALIDIHAEHQGKTRRELQRKPSTCSPGTAPTTASSAA